MRAEHTPGPWKISGYHFTGIKLRDGRAIPAIGEWLEHDGPVEPCVAGLHMSEHPFDALTYSPGSMLHLVELDGDIQPHGRPTDKWVGRRRRIVASVDATEMLQKFARWCAFEVIDLWDAPPTVREYLTTGNERLREEAGEAARAAARAAMAAGAAARAATWAARAATWAARAATGEEEIAAREAAEVAEMAARTPAGTAAGVTRTNPRAKFEQMALLALAGCGGSAVSD